LVWLKLIVCVLVIFFAGQKVAKFGDIIAEKTGFGRVWMGVIAIALITSLPELFAGISAVTIVKKPDLTVGNLVGANAFNLVNLALLDFLHHRGSIFPGASPSHRVTAWYSLLVLAAVAAGLSLSLAGHSPALGWIGWYTPVIFVLYAFSVRQIFNYEKVHIRTPETPFYDHITNFRKVVLYFIIASLFIVGAGIWLAVIGDEIAAATGWGETFVGSIFLAFTTTLPEITVSFTALRIGAVDMAIANMIGSNLFNLAILGITDLCYTRGPVLADVSPAALVTAGVVGAMSLLLILGLSRPPRRFFRASWLNTGLTVLFLIGAYFSFSLA
jgi:cation:H+ antiporter